MQLRTNRTTNNPGLVDLPNKRRSASDVAAETSKKREAAAAKASKKREQEARVASLEKEIKTAQREALRARVKKTFPAPQIDEDEVEEVRLCYPMHRLVPAIHLTLFRPPVPLSPRPASRTRGTGRRGRRQRWSQSTVGALSRRRLPGVSRTTIFVHRSNPIIDCQGSATSPTHPQPPTWGQRTNPGAWPKQDVTLLLPTLSLRTFPTRRAILMTNQRRNQGTIWSSLALRPIA